MNTWVLIIILNSTNIAIPGYQTESYCQIAARQAKASLEQQKPVIFCILGPDMR